jgi:hypothetical protein
MRNVLGALRSRILFERQARMKDKVAAFTGAVERLDRGGSLTDVRHTFGAAFYEMNHVARAARHSGIFQSLAEREAVERVYGDTLQEVKRALEAAKNAATDQAKGFFAEATQRMQKLSEFWRITIKQREAVRAGQTEGQRIS